MVVLKHLRCWRRLGGDWAGGALSAHRYQCRTLALTAQHSSNAGTLGTIFANLATRVRTCSPSGAKVALEVLSKAMQAACPPRSHFTDSDGLVPSGFPAISSSSVQLLVMGTLKVATAAMAAHARDCDGVQRAGCAIIKAAAARLPEARSGALLSDASAIDALVAALARHLDVASLAADVLGAIASICTEEQGTVAARRVLQCGGLEAIVACASTQMAVRMHTTLSAPPNSARFVSLTRGLSLLLSNSSLFRCPCPPPNPSPTFRASVASPAPLPQDRIWPPAMQAVLALTPAVEALASAQHAAELESLGPKGTDRHKLRKTVRGVTEWMAAASKRARTGPQLPRPGAGQ